MKKYILLILSIIMAFYVYSNAKAEESIIPDEAIRFRIIANSNTMYDQNIKLQVRNVVQNKVLSLLKDVKTIDETRNIIKNNMDELNKVVQDELQKLEYDKDFTINYGYNYFPEKKYKGIKYDEGEYESLVIKLGDAKGDNFWCVLFPPLCLVEVEEDNTNDAEYTFFIKELINSYISK